MDEWMDRQMHQYNQFLFAQMTNDLSLKGKTFFQPAVLSKEMRHLGTTWEGSEQSQEDGFLDFKKTIKRKQR